MSGRLGRVALGAKERKKGFSVGSLSLVDGHLPRIVAPLQKISSVRPNLRLLPLPFLSWFDLTLIEAAARATELFGFFGGGGNGPKNIFEVRGRGCGSTKQASGSCFVSVKKKVLLLSPSVVDPDLPRIDVPLQRISSALHIRSMTVCVH